jgi:transcriptional regulator GlxA family with amidase domain
MKTILVLAMNGMMDSGVAITLDTLRAGQQFQPRNAKRNSVRIMTAAHTQTVTLAGGMQLRVDVTLAQLAREDWTPDWVIVPGLGLTSDQMIAQRFAKKDAIAAIAMLQALPPTTRVGASCSGVFLLAQSGLLHGRHVTMTWWLASVFRTRHPDVKLDETRMLVTDGPFLTAGSAFAQLDLTLAIVADVMGAVTAETCSRYLLIDQRPSQARYMIPSHKQYADPTVVAAERWIDMRLAEPINVGELASALAVSTKTLARRLDATLGLSPVKFIQQRRMLHAAHLIESTSMSIEAVAEKVGYQDATALRKLIKRGFGMTPTALRR